MHRSSIAKDINENLLQYLKAQLDTKIYLVHRLDRKTSGAMVVTTSKEAQSNISQLFEQRQVYKEYVALVRGYTDDHGTIDYPIKDIKSKLKDAFTTYETIERYEIELANDRYNTSRYSLIRLVPETGRYHQLRMHMAHIRHPIIGDRPHGCNKQNRIWKQKLNNSNMHLHARRLSFIHNELDVSIEAEMRPYFVKTLEMLSDSKI